MASNSLKKIKIDKFFLEEMNPYTKRRPFKVKTVAWVGGVFLILLFILIIYFGSEEEKRAEKGSVPDYPSSNGGGDSSSDKDDKKQGGGVSGFFDRVTGDLPSISKSSRTYGASQVVRRGQGADQDAQLPMGFGIPVRLVNSVMSSNGTSPVVAEVTEDIFSHGSLSIPAGTRVIGQATADERSQRIQIKFSTFVYPEGDQHTFDGLALMGDGSAGLSGEYHSGNAKRQAGRFIDTFVGGVAEGLKDKQSAGIGAYDVGSLKNGLLNGVSLSAQDQAKEFSDDLAQTKPFITLNADLRFVIFLEKEFSP